MTIRNPSPEQIEQEISSTRADIDQTLDALQNKLSPGELLDQALSYAKDGGGAFAGNLGRSLRDNPLPVALMGIGLGWLMFAGRSDPQDGGRAYGYRADDYRGEAYDRGDTRQHDDPGYDPGLGSYTYKRYNRDFYDTHRDHDPADVNLASGPRHEDESATGGIADKAAEMASGAKERIEDAAARVGEVRDELGARISDARRSADAYGRRAKRSLEHAGDSAGAYYRENPLVVGALALGAGAALGALLPSTRREDALLGAQSDEAKAKADEALAEGAKRAKTVAKAALDAGKAEAKRQSETKDDAMPNAASGESAATTPTPTGDSVAPSGKTPGAGVPPHPPVR